MASFSLAGHRGLGESPHRYGPGMAAAIEASSPPLSARATRWEPKCLMIARIAPDQIRVLWGVGRGPTDAPIKVDPQTAQIFKLPTMINPGAYPKQLPFGGMGKPVNQKRILRPLPNHDQSHRGRLDRLPGGQPPPSATDSVTVPTGRRSTRPKLVAQTVDC